MLQPFPAFCLCLLAFHAGELAFVATVTPRHLSRRSLLLSPPYCLAMGLAAAEYHLEAWLLPAAKQAAQGWVSWAGLLCCLAGEGIRKAAMLTAGRSFTHLLQSEQEAGHTLVTGGIYRHVRHPGYLGWGVWALGTQLLLANPLCFLGFAVVVQRFFARRISVEEQHLARFFGDAYRQYAALTPTYIPFVE